MKKQLFFISLTICLSLFFTNCQKSSVAEDQEELAQLATNEFDESIFENFIPNLDAPDITRLINETPTTDFLIKELSNFEEVAQARMTRSRTRNRDFSSSAASASLEEEKAVSTYKKAKLYCGKEIYSTTKFYPYDQGNGYDNDFYRELGFNTNLNGTDRSFYIRIDREQIVTLRLRGARENLAMFLFKGAVEVGTNIAEETSKLVTYSTSNSRYSENLGPTRLMPGEYILIVDSRPNRGSDFQIDMHCRNVHDDCDNGIGQTLIADRLEYYTKGDVSPQSVYWEKWHPESTDGRVFEGYSNDQDLLIQESTDIIHCIGERKHGYYRMRFNMYFPRNAKGYMDIQKVLELGNDGNEIGATINFQGRGEGVLKIAGRNHHFDYPERDWFTCVFDFDLDKRKTTFKIDGHTIWEWDTRDTRDRRRNGMNQIEGLSFWAKNQHYAFVVDNFCFSKR